MQHIIHAMINSRVHCCAIYSLGLGQLCSIVTKFKSMTIIQYKTVLKSNLIFLIWNVAKKIVTLCTCREFNLVHTWLSILTAVKFTLLRNKLLALLYHMVATSINTCYIIIHEGYVCHSYLTICHVCLVQLNNNNL